jgi:hypothetical protein
MQEVRLAPIRRGYDYELAVNWPAGFLGSGETLRAELRRTPAQTVPTATFMAERDGDTVTLSLPKTVTADIPTKVHLMDWTLVMSAGAEEPIRDPRFTILVEDHVTRASE